MGVRGPVTGELWGAVWLVPDPRADVFEPLHLQRKPPVSDIFERRENDHPPARPSCDGSGKRRSKILADRPVAQIPPQDGAGPAQWVRARAGVKVFRVGGIGQYEIDAVETLEPSDPATVLDHGTEPAPNGSLAESAKNCGLPEAPLPPCESGGT